MIPLFVDIAGIFLAHAMSGLDDKPKTTQDDVDRVKEAMGIHTVKGPYDYDETCRNQNRKPNTQGLWEWVDDTIDVEAHETDKTADVDFTDDSH